MKLTQKKFFQLARIVIILVAFLVGAAGSVADNGNGDGPHFARTPSATVVPIIYTAGQTVGPDTAATMGAIAPPELTERWRASVAEYDPDYTVIEAYIKNGELTTRHPAVGVLLEATTTGEYYAICSGIMVDSETFLTAAHCVKNRNNINVTYAVYLQRVGVIPGTGGIVTFCDDHEC